MGLAGVAALAIGAVMVTLGINLVLDWRLNELLCATDAEVTGIASSAFCTNVGWKTVVEYLPVLLFLGQVLVVIVMGSPVALLRRR